MSNIICAGVRSHVLALFLGWSLLCLDSLLVPQFGVPEIGHRQVVGQALVQWQILLDLPQGVFVVIDTHWVLCYFLTTRSCCVLTGSFCYLRSATWGRSGKARFSVKL